MMNQLIDISAVVYRSVQISCWSDPVFINASLLLVKPHFSELFSCSVMFHVHSTVIFHKAVVARYSVLHFVKDLAS